MAVMLPVIGGVFGGFLAYREWRVKVKKGSVLTAPLPETVARGIVCGAFLGVGVALIGSLLSA